MNDDYTLVIFGASGDLAHRKLMPALFNLFRKGRLSKNFQILGTAMRKWDDSLFQKSILEGILRFAGYKFEDDEWSQFATHLKYLPGDFTLAESYKQLALVLQNIHMKPANQLYYLATSPDYFLPILEGLANNDLLNETHARRLVVVEKPYGTDLSSAQQLNQAVHSMMHEDQIYRIDHYLGKETVLNLLTFRFANTIFEPIWNRNYVDHVQITVAETIGVEHRAGYYDEIGVLRDMFQNHLLQLLCLVAMEPPATYRSEAMRDEKVKVLNSIRPLTAQEISQSTLRGQYLGYLNEPKVQAGSQTATFAVVRMYIDNWRWQGVPFYLRSGKKLKEKCSEIIIQFKCPPHGMLQLPADYALTANTLGISIQPDEGIHLSFEAKVPDTTAETRHVDMEFHYRDSFGAGSIPEAYERLLLDALNDDPSLFIRDDQTENAWALIDPILHTWKSKQVPSLCSYEPGSWGPAEAEELLAQDKRRWIYICQDKPKEFI